MSTLSPHELQVGFSAALGYVQRVEAVVKPFAGFKELRVGRNELGELCVLAIAPGHHIEDLETMRDCAREEEAKQMEEGGYNLSIWTITDGHLDTVSVATDFPWRVYE